MSVTVDKIKQYGPKALPFIIVLFVGSAIGWSIKPTRVDVQEKERVVEKEVTTQAQKDLMKSFEDLKIELQKVRETQVVEKYHREVLETKLADGTYTKKTTVDKNIDSHTKETETKTEVKVVEVEKKIETIKTEYVDKIVEKEKIVKVAPTNWHLGVLGGVKPQFLPVPAATFVVGGEVERRIAGPIFLGVWGLGTGEGIGMGGLSVKVELP